MTVRVIDAISIAGDAINEDRIGHARYPSGVAAAWVIDGATGLADREWVSQGPTDAAWLADALSQRLTADDPASVPAPAYFARQVAAIGADYRAAVPDWRMLPSWVLPSAATMWLRRVGARVELAWLGDCVALIEQDGGLVVAGAEEARSWEDDINRVVGARLAAEPTLATPVMAAVMDELRTRRARLNQPDGYWMLGVDPRAAAAMDVRTLALAAPARALIVSDGLWRLVDHFHVYDAAGLLRAAFDAGLAALLAELRGLEGDDADCRRVPRVKPRDDASGLALLVGTGG